MRWLIGVLILALVQAGAAVEIYKWILPDGSVEYSDRPPVEGAERVDLKPLVTYTPPAPPAPSVPAETNLAEEDEGYDRFAITSPANDMAIRDNAGNITISFAITPALAEGHAIDVFIDGRKYGRSTEAVFTLSGVNRGTHRIHAIIVNDSGAELARAATVTVHLKRASNLL